MKRLSKGLGGTSLVALCAVTFGTAAVAQSIDCDSAYTIASGDTLSAINARAYGGGTFHALYDHNRAVIGANPNLIYVGQVIQVPCRAGVTVVAEAQTPPRPTEQAPAAAAAPVVAAPIAAAQDAPVVATAGDTGATDAGTVFLTFNKASAPGFIINTGIIDLFLADVAAVTEGRVQFLSPMDVNHDHSAQYDLVMSGEVDGAYVLNSHLAESHPLLQLSMMPLMGGSAEQTAVSMWRLHEQYLSQTTYFDEAQLLGFVASPAAHIWRDQSDPVEAGEAILNQNDYPTPYFEGLDVRGPKAIRQEMADWLGQYNEANDEPPTYFMAHGAVRAVGLWTQDMQVTEVDYGVYTPTFSVILSNDAWARISPADQAAIMEIAGENLSTRSASWDAFDNGFRSDMLMNGLNFVKADEALEQDLQAQAQAGLLDWKETANALGISGDEAIAFYQDSLKQLEDRLLFR